MERTYLNFIVFSFGTLLFLSALFHGVPAVTAGTYRVVLDECKKRTGLGESFCKSIVKNNLNVKSCMEKASLSEKECEKRIQEIKNDPEFTGVSQVPVSTTPTQTAPGVPSHSIALERTTIQYDDLIGRIRSKKENNLIDLGKRTESILAILRKQGVNTTHIEENFPEFEKKVANLLAAYDTFRAAYIGTTKDSDSVKAAVRGDARTAVVISLNELVDYYRNQILAPIRIARDQIK